MIINGIFECPAFYVSFILGKIRDIDVACFYDQDDSIVAHGGYLSVWFWGYKSRRLGLAFLSIHYLKIILERYLDM